MIFDRIVLISCVIALFNAILYFVIYTNLKYTNTKKHAIATFTTYILSFLINRQFFFPETNIFTHKLFYFVLISIFTTSLAAILVHISNLKREKKKLIYNYIINTFIGIFVTVPLRKKFVFV